MTDYLRDLRATASGDTAGAAADADGFSSGGALDFLADMEQAGAQVAAEADGDILEGEEQEEDDEEEEGNLCEDADTAAPSVRFAMPKLSFAAAAPEPTLIPALSSSASSMRRSSMPSANAAAESAVVLPLQKVAAGGAKRVVAKKDKAAKPASATSTAGAANVPAAVTKKSALASAAALPQGARPLRGQSVYIGSKPAATKRNGPSAREIAQERAGILLSKTASTSSLHADEPLSARGKENPSSNGGDISARRTGVSITSRYMKSASCATTNSHVIEKTVHLQPAQSITARVPASTATTAASATSGAATARRSSMTDVASLVVAARSTAHAGKRRSAAMDQASTGATATEAPLESTEGGSASKKARHDRDGLELELMARAPFCSPVAESPSSGNAELLASPEVTAVISRKLSFAEGVAADAEESKMADADAAPIAVGIVPVHNEPAAVPAAVASVALTSEERDHFVTALAAKDAELSALRSELSASLARASELDSDNCKTRALLTEAWESEEKYKTLHRDLESKHTALNLALEAAKSDAASSLKRYEVIRAQHDKQQHVKHMLMKRVEELEKAAKDAVAGAGTAGAAEWGSAASFNFEASAAATAGVETRRATMAVTHSATGLLSKRK